MKFQLIRNATSLIGYGGKTFLIDPMLADQGAYPAFDNTPNAQQRNPLVPLPVPLESLLDVDAMIITHTHADHWDAVAAQRIPKSTLVFVQHQQDATILHQAGFHRVQILSDTTQFADIRLFKTQGQHGSDKTMSNPVLRQRLGDVCGVVMMHAAEKALYLAGDTLWNTDVASALTHFKPDVVVLNCGEATLNEEDAIIIGADDVRRVGEAAPQATLIASHMEALNHCILSRQALRDAVVASGQAGRVRIPADGEAYVF